MNLINFLNVKAVRTLTPFLLILLFLAKVSFLSYQKQEKKSDEQNVAIIDINTSTIALTDITEPEKGNLNRTPGTYYLRNYFNNSAKIVFKIYASLVKDDLCDSNSHTFIISHFSTDI